jgi:hypothetical protein
MSWSVITIVIVILCIRILLARVTLKVIRRVPPPLDSNLKRLLALIENRKPISRISPIDHREGRFNLQQVFLTAWATLHIKPHNLCWEFLNPVQLAHTLPILLPSCNRFSWMLPSSWISSVPASRMWFALETLSIGVQSFVEEMLDSREGRW